MPGFEGSLSRRGFLRGVGAAAAALSAVGSLPAHAEERPPAPRGKLRFGVQPRPEHVSWSNLARAFREADELGLDSAFTFDHFMPIDGRTGPCLEGWTSLAALAAKTERIKTGVLVTGNGYRNPALLAKMAATVDQVSNGRLILGMGAGWFEAEYMAYDFQFYTPGERARRLVEAVGVLKALTAQQPASFAGKYYTLRNAPFDPPFVQRPHAPLLIGGMGPKVIQPLAARHADIWHFFVKGGDPEETRKLVSGFDDICRQVGRDPAAVEKAVSLRPADVAGTPPDQVRARIQALAGAGVSHFILSLPAPYDWSVLRAFAKDVVPPLRTA
jgi:alkanesulfonate monooxygenase SsuD/methylene tetrahydromethanopterin reductase-like flavin-dependent oxidoreductase (luciferase family)